MQLDYFSLVIAVGFSGAALGLMLLVSWISARTESFLLIWATAMALFVSGVLLFADLRVTYQPIVHLGSLLFFLGGVTLVREGTANLLSGQLNWKRTALLALAQSILVSAAFLLGYSALGTIFVNILAGILLCQAGLDFWRGRREARMTMAANAILLWVVSFTFFLCAVPLILDGDVALTALPASWAEEINAIMSIFGLTSIGAVSLTVHHARIARRHQADAMTDALTGLRNRRALFDAMESKPLQTGTAVLVLDLDHFKKINDRFGHASGDAVLKYFTKILREQTTEDDLTARIGGEEFCIVTSGASMQHIMALAETIRLELTRNPVTASGKEITATVSIGAAIAHDSTVTFAELFESADRALYGAKNDGRNQVRCANFLIVAA